MIKFETIGAEGCSLEMRGGVLELLAELGAVVTKALNGMSDNEKDFRKLKDMLISALINCAEYCPETKEDPNGNE